MKLRHSNTLMRAIRLCAQSRMPTGDSDSCSGSEVTAGASGIGCFTTPLNGITRAARGGAGGLLLFAMRMTIRMDVDGLKVCHRKLQNGWCLELGFFKR